LILAGSLICGLASTPLYAGEPAPQITKVEPPNWWISFNSDVMLLLSGNNLQQPRVSTSTPGVRVTRTQPGANNHYLFVWLQILAGAKPGVASITVRTNSGAATIDFPILPRHIRQNRTADVTLDDVIYLIMPDRFADGDPSNDRPPHSTGVCDRGQPKAYHGGDLRGIRDHLAYLHDLGVTTLWLTPVWKNTDSDYHGYHVVDFYGVDDHMGTLREYQDLVAHAHRLGMKVIIDYVINHTGPHHPWAADPPLSDWFHGSVDHHLAATYHFDGLVDPHATPRQYRSVIEGWFADKLPDLNTDENLVEKYVGENALWWSETADLDGFRLDTFPYSSRVSWSHWHHDVRQVYPNLFSIAEASDKDPEVTSFFEGGRPRFDGVDSGATTVFDFPLEYALRDVINGGMPMQRIIDVLRQDDLYLLPDELVTFIGNHDHVRFLSEPGSSIEKLKAAFSLLLTLRGIPQIYSGDEIGMLGGEDPDNRRDFPGGFPGDQQNAFTAAGRTPEQQDVFAHVQQLLRLREAHPALREGRQSNIAWDDQYLAFVRERGTDRVLVIFNNSSQPREIKFPVADTPLFRTTRMDLILGTARAAVKNNEVSATVPARGVAIYSVSSQ
jgi:glycosidase